MKNKAAKRVTSALCLMALIGSTIVPSYAAEKTLLVSPSAMAEEKAVDTREPNAEKLEAIIKLVKPKLDVPEDYTEFNWNYYDGSVYSAPSWNLSWSRTKSDGRYGSVDVTCDEDGHVLSYYAYADGVAQQGVPNYTASELKDKATEIVRRLSGCDTLQYTDCNPSYSAAYEYTFERQENGIRYPENTARVRLNYLDGSLLSYDNGVEYKAVLSPAEKLIGAEKAVGLYGNGSTMSLRYLLCRETNEDGTTKNVARLVYSPDSAYRSVDAVTGEVYTERSTFTDNSAARKSAAYADAVPEEAAMDAGEGGYQLSEQELAQLDVLDGLLKKDEAIGVIRNNDALYLDEALTAVDADLTKRTYYGPYYGDTGREEDASYIWSIRFSNPRPDADYYAYAYATVDAKDGTLLSFSSSLKSYYYYDSHELTPPEKKYSAEQCRDIFESFVKKINPVRFALTQKSDDYETNVLYYRNDAKGEPSIPVYGARKYRYVRVNEGIPFTYDSIGGTVDAVTGKISQYSYSWTEEITFESPKNVITPEKAYAAYIANASFEPYYETYNEYIYEGDSVYDRRVTARLVYKPYGFRGYIAALTGKNVDYNGEEFPAPYEGDYKDIAGHWAERYIQLLHDIGAFDDAESFRPDEKMNAQEFRDLLSRAGTYYYYVSADGAVTANTGDALSRADAVRLIIDQLGYGKVARMADIYKTDYTDNPEVKPEDVGYLAIAGGFGIIDGDADTHTFRPNETISRAEAAKLAIKMLEVQYAE